MKRKKQRGKGAAKQRVHLKVIHDAASGNVRIDLNAPVFEEPWQNEVTTATVNTAYALVGTAPTLDGMLELAASAMAGTSRLADGLLARAPAGSVACKAGCDHCCYQLVGVTVPEALAIASHLKSRRSESQLVELVQRLGELSEKTQQLSAEARFSPEYPCAFLVAGRCSIYEVRPLSCRGMNSLDARACEQRLRDPSTREQFLREGSGALTFMEPIRAFHAVSAGLQIGLSELYELDMRPLELTRAVLHLLRAPEDVASEWLTGGKPFESALGGDNTADARARALSGAKR